MPEKVIEERSEKNLDIIHLQGEHGYQTEHLSISRTLNNGLRLEISDDGEEQDGSDGSDGWWSFHIHSPETARLIAEKLLAFADRHFGQPLP